MTSIKPVNPIVNKLSQLATEKSLAAINGNYKEFKTASKAYAKVAADHLDLLPQVGGLGVVNVPMFTKIGMKMAKVWFLNLFRKKTPEEKILRNYCKTLKNAQRTEC